MPFLRAAFRKESSWTQGFLLAVVSGPFCCWYSESLLNYQKSPGSLVSLSYAIASSGLALAILAWADTWPSVELAHRSRHHFSVVFWEQVLTNILGDGFWVEPSSWRSIGRPPSATIETFCQSHSSSVYSPLFRYFSTCRWLRFPSGPLVLFTEEVASQMGRGPRGSGGSAACGLAGSDWPHRGTSPDGCVARLSGSGS